MTDTAACVGKCLRTPHVQDLDHLLLTDDGQEMLRFQGVS
jgi:hypothetical protein